MTVRNRRRRSLGARAAQAEPEAQRAAPAAADAVGRVPGSLHEPPSPSSPRASSRVGRSGSSHTRRRRSSAGPAAVAALQPRRHMRLADPRHGRVTGWAVGMEDGQTLARFWEKAQASELGAREDRQAAVHCVHAEDDRCRLRAERRPARRLVHFSHRQFSEAGFGFRQFSSKSV